jgi:peroxiredoxin Q/BCP
MLTVGTRAPDFTLADHAGRSVSLRELNAAGPVVVFFYPADFTPGCTREVCMVRDLHAELQVAGLTVVGISPNDTATHERFRQHHRLPFTLLADPDKRAIKAYGVDGPFGFGVRRATFLIDGNGIIRDVVSAALRIAKHEQFLRNALRQVSRP